MAAPFSFAAHLANQSELHSQSDQSYRYGGNNHVGSGDWVVNLGAGTQYAALNKSDSQRAEPDPSPNVNRGVAGGLGGNSQQYMLLAGGLLVLVLVLKKMKKR
jgi:hypothetical protein